MGIAMGCLLAIVFAPELFAPINADIPLLAFASPQETRVLAGMKEVDPRPPQTEGSSASTFPPRFPLPPFSDFVARLRTGDVVAFRQPRWSEGSIQGQCAWGSARLPRSAFDSIIFSGPGKAVLREDGSASPSRWRIDGNISVVKEGCADQGWRLDGKVTLERTLAPPMDRGAFECFFFDPGIDHAGSTLTLEFHFQAGPAAIIELVGSEKVYRAGPIGRRATPSTVARTAGWHRAALDFQQRTLFATVDDAVLLSEWEESSTPRRLEKVVFRSSGGPIRLDEVSLFERSTDAIGAIGASGGIDRGAADRLTTWGGDQWNGRLTAWNDRFVVMRSGNDDASIPLADVRSLRFQRDSWPPSVWSGTIGELALRDGSRMVVSLEGEEESHWRVAHPTLGRLNLSTSLISSWRFLFRGERIVREVGEDLDADSDEGPAPGDANSPNKAGARGVVRVPFVVSSPGPGRLWLDIIGEFDDWRLPPTGGSERDLAAGLSLSLNERPLTGWRNEADRGATPLGIDGRFPLERYLGVPVRTLLVVDLPPGMVRKGENVVEARAKPRGSGSTGDRKIVRMILDIRQASDVRDADRKDP